MSRVHSVAGPGPRTLGALVDESRLLTGELDGSREALTDDTISLTWRQYVDRVARLAGALTGAGVAPGDRVAVHLSKTVESFVAVHAVLRAGAVMVPVDPMAPVGYAAAVIADAGATVLISDARASVLADLVAAAGPDCVVLPRSDDPTTVGGHAGMTVITRSSVATTAASPMVDVAESDPAYIIYTSGSTGQPKGIVHTHRSALAYAATAAETYGLLPADRMANIAPLHFDQSTFELYSAPLAGAAVVVVPEPVLRFPASVSELVDRQRVTVWYSVPYLLGELSTRGALEERDLSSVRWVLFGGEAFPPGRLERLMGQLPAARFSNVYGPAEVNQCTMYHLSEPPRSDEVVPIGQAWPGADVDIVDPDDLTRPVPAGRAGVLLVRSATMMSRYWNRPDLTAASIVERPGTDASDPVADVERWYVTGDLVVERDDGNLVFLGRVDNQIKLRGHRIELEAVDAALADLDGVQEGTVVVDRSESGEDGLVAVVVPVPGARAEGSTLESAVLSGLRRRLPRSSVPARVVTVDALPRTGTGKIDRNAARLLVMPLRSTQESAQLRGEMT